MRNIKTKVVVPTYRNQTIKQNGQITLNCEKRKDKRIEFLVVDAPREKSLLLCG